MPNPVSELLPKNLNDETRALIWRLLLTVIIVLYIAWSNNAIDQSGHVLQGQFRDYQTNVREKMGAFHTRVGRLESEVMDVSDGFVILRRDSVKNAIFEISARLCELRANAENRELQEMYEQEILELTEQYRTLAGGSYPIKSCTGLGG